MKFLDLPGLNNSAGGNMIMTNSNMNMGMAGGSLVVSSSVNKPLPNAANMMGSNQAHHGQNHPIPPVNVHYCNFEITNFICDKL